ncbi:hypothetical protein AC249_AIPGENE22875 [Exaiptasia diaphana]|nr:hypothetical protein AC249_AIPGENE22875 [Exaiptasia diaphana]
MDAEESKGSDSINRANLERYEDITTAGEYVHQTCRRTYCHPTAIAQARKRKNDDDDDDNSTCNQPRRLIRKAEQCFKRSEQAITLNSRNTVKIGKEDVQIDPQLLFQRLVLACDTADDMESMFKYELCTYPSSLFEAPGIMR